MSFVPHSFNLHDFLSHLPLLGLAISKEIPMDDNGLKTLIRDLAGAAIIGLVTGFVILQGVTIKLETRLDTVENRQVEIVNIQAAQGSVLTDLRIELARHTANGKKELP